MTARLRSDPGHDDLARTLSRIAASASSGEDQSRPFSRAVWQQLADVGVFGIVAAGGTPADLVAAVEALGAHALAGPVLAAVLVWVGTTMLALTSHGFAYANLLLIAVWLGLAYVLYREYRRRSSALPQ